MATVVNLVVSGGLYIATSRTATIAKQVLEAANRPCIGTERIGCVVDSQRPLMRFRIELKNYGTAPADETRMTYQALLNGAVQPATSLPDRPRIFFPGHILRFADAEVHEPVFHRLMDGSSTLVLRLHVSYKGPGNKAYSYDEEYQYYPRVNEFLILGPPESGVQPQA